MKYIIEKFNELVRSQGLALAVLLGLFVWRENYTLNVYQKLESEIRRLDKKSDRCQEQIIELYYNNQIELIEALDRSTEAIENINRK